MASMTVPVTAVPQARSAAVPRHVPAWLAPAVAAGLGAFAGVAGTWVVIATQTLHMSF